MTHSQARFSLSMTCTSHVWNLSLRCLKISCLVLSFVLCFVYFFIFSGPSWSWSYGSWIYNYLCNQCLSPLKLWVQIPFMAMCTRYNIILIYIYICDKVCQRLATGRWFVSGTPVSSTNKTDCHNITEILLKVALNTIKSLVVASLVLSTHSAFSLHVLVIIFLKRTRKSLLLVV